MSIESVEVLQINWKNAKKCWTNFVHCILFSCFSVSLLHAFFIRIECIDLLLKLFLKFLVIPFSNPPLILSLKDIRYNLKCEIVIDISQHNNRSNNFNQFTPVTVLYFFLPFFSFPISFLCWETFFCLFFKVFMKFNSNNRKILKLLDVFLLKLKVRLKIVNKFYEQPTSSTQMLMIIENTQESLSGWKFSKIS